MANACVYAFRANKGIHTKFLHNEGNFFRNGLDKY